MSGAELITRGLPVRLGAALSSDLLLFDSRSPS
jgi:hypothetical protein